MADHAIGAWGAVRRGREGDKARGHDVLDRLDRLIDRFPMTAATIGCLVAVPMLVAWFCGSRMASRFVLAVIPDDKLLAISLVALVSLLLLFPALGWFYLFLCIMEPPANPNRKRLSGR